MPECTEPRSPGDVRWSPAVSGDPHKRQHFDLLVLNDVPVYPIWTIVCLVHLLLLNALLILGVTTKSLDAYGASIIPHSGSECARYHSWDEGSCHLL